MKEQQDLIPMATGEYLKQQRLAKKLSLSTVSESINLDEQILLAIEEDCLEEIARVYRNGYIQNYARFLNIPEDEIQVMTESHEADEPVIQNIFAEAPRRNSAERWLRSTSYVLASLLIGTLAWQFTHEAVRLSQNGPRLNKANEAVSPAEENGPDSKSVSGTVNASIASLGALHGNQNTGLDPAEQAWAAITQPELADGESLLQLSVSADSWIEISDATGEELEMDLLRGGSEKSYQGFPPFRILIGRTSAVHLSVDGEKLDLTPFSNEDVAQFSWPNNIQTEVNDPDSD